MVQVEFRRIDWNMREKLSRFPTHMRSAFSRQATYHWFVSVFVGFMAHTDTFGISSIVRTLMLTPENEGLNGIADTAESKHPKTIQIVHMDQQTARAMGEMDYLVLDAYFAVGPVFQETAAKRGNDGSLVHILTRTKKNVVAYLPATSPKKRKRGKPKKYGKKLKLMKLFDSTAKTYTFQIARMRIYHGQEDVQYLTLNLLWKPIKGMLRFILVESSRGRMILISSDLELAPRAAIELYCRRVGIETLLDTLKNTLGTMTYHFWSQYLDPASRRHRKNAPKHRHTENPEHMISVVEIFYMLLCKLTRIRYSRWLGRSVGRMTKETL